MGFARKKRSTKKVPATIYFRKKTNENQHKQVCVYAQCSLSEITVGPVWGHTDAAVRKVVAELTRNCDCPAQFHVAREFVGRRHISRKTA